MIGCPAMAIGTSFRPDENSCHPQSACLSTPDGFSTERAWGDCPWELFTQLFGDLGLASTIWLRKHCHFTATSEGSRGPRRSCTFSVRWSAYRSSARDLSQSHRRLPTGWKPSLPIMDADRRDEKRRAKEEQWSCLCNAHGAGDDAYGRLLHLQEKGAGAELSTEYPKRHQGSKLTESRPPTHKLHEHNSNPRRNPGSRVIFFLPLPALISSSVLFLIPPFFHVPPHSFLPLFTIIYTRTPSLCRRISLLSKFFSHPSYFLCLFFFALYPMIPPPFFFSFSLRYS